MGPIALHGGGEFSAADRPFLLALLAAAQRSVASRVRACVPRDEVLDGSGRIRIALVTTAAAHQRPELAAANGERAFLLAAESAGLAVRVEHVPVVDAASASSAQLAGRLAGSDLVYLPGGDPGLVVEVLAGTLAWRSIVAANARGAVVAGASAGAMGFAEWTWTPQGGRPGLGLLRGLYVVPHDDHRRAGSLSRDTGVPPHLGRLGLAEATGVIGRPGGEWRVAGPGTVSWRPHDGPEQTARSGEVVRLGR